MKVKDIIRTKWQYGVAFLLPWIIVLVHSLVRDSWMTGGGSILAEEAGTLYFPLYSELWDKVHNGGSFSFSWLSGLGTGFLVNMFRYLMSPFTLIILLVPKAWISDVIQFIMVLKWSLLSVSTLYYFMNTGQNRLERRKTMLSVIFAMAFFLSNTVISVLYDLAALDVMILFPILLLLVEQMVEKRNYKLFYILFALSFVMNYQLAIPMAIFLVFWFAIQCDDGNLQDKKCILCFLFTYVAAIVTGLIVLIPTIASGVGMVSKGKEVTLQIGEFIHRFFVCDSLWLYQKEKPMLYCSVVHVLIAMLYVFTKCAIRKKILVCILTVFLCLGMMTEIGNLIWNGSLRLSGEFGFLLAFLVIYMAMETLMNLDSVHAWNVILVGLLGVAGVVYGFFSVQLFLDFYVYLGTLMIVVFIMLMLIFYRRKSVKYHNVLIVFSVVCLLELAINAYTQLDVYNMNKMEDAYYHRNIENLAENISLQNGERIAMTQVMQNYGMKLNLPGASQEHFVVNDKVSELYKGLGMEWNEKRSGYFGGSPLLNLMFNIRYGSGQSAVPFSDCEKIKSAKDYNLYEMNRLAGIGYMAKKEVENWSVEKKSPFEVQNDFVKDSTGKGPIFDIITPDITCTSLTGMNPEADHHDHDHEEGEMCEEEIYHGEYKDGYYFYQFCKMYFEDFVTMEFESDGTSDYYIYVDSMADSYYHVKVGEEYIFNDQISGKKKTFHIGVVPEGTKISVISDAEVDDVVMTQIEYQVAAFNEDMYQEVYDSLSSNVLQIDQYQDGYIKGKIAVEEEGIMMTSIPSQPGMSVYVDGSKAEYKEIGGAFIGVPLNAGDHEIEIRYQIPYLIVGVLVSCIGIVLFILCYYFYIKRSVENRIEE